MATALAYIGTPYRWGGDDPSGFDCSGLVLECLKSAGLIRSGDYTADGLLKLFGSCEVTRPVPGGLVFRLDSDGRADHVAVCLDRWFQVGAEGGNRTVRSPSEARRDNAFVRIRPIPPAGSRRKICDPFVDKGATNG